LFLLRRMLEAGLGPDDVVLRLPDARVLADLAVEALDGHG
jgi:hypothetical protein